MVGPLLARFVSESESEQRRTNQLLTIVAARRVIFMIVRKDLKECETRSVPTAARINVFSHF